jgi:hypothetical protein
MAIVANTFTTYDAVGIREDLSDIIYNISPEETPFISNAARKSAKQTLFEWQSDALNAASTSNAVLDGDDVASFAAVTPTTRLGNYTQISRKDVVISGTTEVVDKAGRKSELSYQLAKRGSELKRDMEAILLYNQAAGAGNTTTARTTAGLPAFLRTNTNAGSGGSDPTVSGGIVNAARTDGTQRAFTETILKDVVKQVYDEGGNPSTLMVGTFNKQAVSAFTGIAGQRFNVRGNRASTIIGAADIYVSDFGNLSIVPNRFQRARDAFVIDFSHLAVRELRPMTQEQLAKTGDAEKRMIICEYGLEVGAEASCGIAADLTTS